MNVAVVVEGDCFEGIGWNVLRIEKCLLLLLLVAALLLLLLVLKVELWLFLKLDLLLLLHQIISNIIRMFHDYSGLLLL